MFNSKTLLIFTDFFSLKIFIASATAVVTLVVTGEPSFGRNAPSITFPSLLVLGGLLTLLDSRRSGKLKNYFRQSVKKSSNSEHFHFEKISPIVGSILLLLWIVILITLIVLRRVELIYDPGNFFENSTSVTPYRLGDSEYRQQCAILFEAMFRIGSLIYGGGQVVLPMLLEEVVNPGWISEAQFFQGFALVQALPGPLFNFAGYIGAIYLGVPGAIIAWLGLFGPGILLILAFLPFWDKVRQFSAFQCFLSGVNAASIGLIMAATAQLWEAAIKNWADAATFFFTGALVYSDPQFTLPRISILWTPICIISGGLFGWALAALDLAQNF